MTDHRHDWRGTPVEQDCSHDRGRIPTRGRRHVHVTCLICGQVNRAMYTVIDRASAADDQAPMA